MKIEALCSMGSGKRNVGDVFEIDNAEGQRLIDRNLAKLSKAKPTLEREVAPIIDMKASREGQEAKKNAAKEVVEKREKKQAEKGKKDKKGKKGGK